MGLNVWMNKEATRNQQQNNNIPLGVPYIKSLSLIPKEDFNLLARCGRVSILSWIALSAQESKSCLASVRWSLAASYLS